MARIRVASCLSLMSGLMMAVLPALASTTRPAVKAFAQVDGTGSVIVASDNVTGVTRVSIGVYEVSFSIKVNKCAWSATVVYPGSPTNGGGAQTGHDGTSKIFVRTGSGGGGPFDSEFHLIVVC